MKLSDDVKIKVFHTLSHDNLRNGKECILPIKVNIYTTCSALRLWQYARI